MFVLMFFFSSTAMTFAKSGTVVLQSGQLNVRAEPTTTGEVIGSVANGQTVEILETLTGWYKIKYGQRSGFVSKDFVREGATGNRVVVTVNGSEVALPFEPPNENNHLLVPFRAIGEALGIDVDWDAREKQVIAKDNGKTVIFTINSKTILVNGEKETVSPAPKIVRDTTLLPLRYFSETFGANVDWNATTKRVTIVREQMPSYEPEPVPEPTPIPMPPPQSISGVFSGFVSSETLNVRSEPNENSDVLGVLRQGEYVDIISFAERWAKIAYDGQEAYVHSYYLNIMSDSERALLLGEVQLSQVGNATKLTWLKLGGNISASQHSNGQLFTVNTNATEIATPLGNIHGIVSLDYIKQPDGYQIELLVEQGYEVRMTNTVGELELTIAPIREKGEGVLGQRIVIDAGHGNQDPGTVGNGLQEKNIVLDVAQRVERLLQNDGADVLMTRSSDTFLSLEERAKFANNNVADIFVSIHANAATNTSANGTETYWNKTNAAQESRELATKIQERLIQKLGTNDRGVREAGFYVIKHTKMPSVLVEIGFVSNAEEAKKLADSGFRQQAAEAIYEGIVDYFNNY